MRCDRCDTLLDAYLDGELAAEEKAALETHLDDCPACRRELEGRRALRRAFAQQPQVTAPEGLRDRILADETVVRHQGSDSPRWWRRAGWPLAVAAAASMAVALLAPSLQDRQDPVDPFSTPQKVVVLRYGDRAEGVAEVRFGGIDLDRNFGRDEK